MSLVDLIMAAEAAQRRTAVRRTAYRHLHVADEPLVVVAYNLSGEAAAPLGITYGTGSSAAEASLAVAAEPRNRESRFAAINSFASDFEAHLRPFLTLTTVPTKSGGFRQVAVDAPQIVVPNRGTRAFLGARLGRSLRYLGLGDTHEVPEATQWTGSLLSWLAEHSNLPGQSVFLAMTESLSQHFVTGQSALEDENLATLLAWIDGFPDDPLPDLERLEDRAFGPVPNPRWEATLEPFVKAYSQGLRSDDHEKTTMAYQRVASEVLTALSLAYEATHRAIQILRAIDPALSVPLRWKRDIDEWSVHARRSASGIPRFARRHDALRSARALQRWSSAAEELETERAFDDPLVMAGLDAAGRCVSGVVRSLDIDNREVKPGNTRQSKVPLVRVTLAAPTRLLIGEVVRWEGDRRVRGEVREVDATNAVIAVISGVKALEDSGMADGDEVLFAGLDPWEGRDPWAPDDLPWTHSEATTSCLAGEVDEDPTAGTDDDTPDLPVEELAELPVVGLVGPDDEPGVLQ